MLSRCRRLSASSTSASSSTSAARSSVPRVRSPPAAALPPASSSNASTPPPPQPPLPGPSQPTAAYPPSAAALSPHPAPRPPAASAVATTTTTTLTSLHAHAPVPGGVGSAALTAVDSQALPNFVEASNAPPAAAPQQLQLPPPPSVLPQPQPVQGGRLATSAPAYASSPPHTTTLAEAAGGTAALAATSTPAELPGYATARSAMVGGFIRKAISFQPLLTAARAPFAPCSLPSPAAPSRSDPSASSRLPSVVYVESRFGGGLVSPLVVPAGTQPPPGALPAARFGAPAAVGIAPPPHRTGGRAGLPPQVRIATSPPASIVLWRAWKSSGRDAREGNVLPR